MYTATQELRDLLVGHGSALPVLFVGSGMSKRYIASPGWEDLLKRFASMAGSSMPYYLAQAESDLPKVASLIADDFLKVWFESNDYEESRAEFEGQVRGKSDPLKFEIAKYLKSLDYVDSPDSKNEILALAKVRAQALITTNWDEVLEETLSEYEVFIGQNDVLFATLQAVGEIYKIHGCATDPRSLILTEEDYKEYWDRNPYLIAKMLTLFVEHPVIFMGYSISDPHIRKLLTNLVECLTVDQLSTLNDRMIFVRWNEDSGAEPCFTNGSLTIADHTLLIKEYTAHSYVDLYEMLSVLPRTFPPKLMRQLKESVYKLAYDSTPQGRVHVVPLEDGDDIQKFEAVIGVGVLDRIGEKGYGHYSREDLMIDMVTNRQDHNEELLISRLLPELFGSSLKYAPVYYPLTICKRFDDNGDIVDFSLLPKKAKELILDKEYLSHHVLDGSPRRRQSFTQLLSAGEKVAIGYGTACKFDNIDDVVKLRDFLHSLLIRTRKTTTEIAKLACQYDRLVYGNEFSGDRDELMKALDGSIKEFKG